MRKIYLASDSLARRKLLEISGLRFEVLPSKIKEIKRLRHLSYAQIVKRNAILKAKEVAKKIKHGIVIAADTIVVQDKKIFGKPKDLKDAKAMLKKISRRPQWLYTGIAIIEKDKDKMLAGFEKTKVYMDRLTDKEVDNYFSAVSPLDKAGSFDIQGKGAFFIRRIEGCFYNVVGLPLRKVYRMLGELGIKIFLFLFCVLNFTLCSFLSGCTTEYNIVTGQQETFYYSTDREVQLGEAIAREVAKEYKFANDPLVQKRVEDIGAKIVSVCDRKDIAYHFSVLEDEEVNAVSLPGGFVYVNKGLIDKVSNDDELAGILGHEVGHIVARHSIKKLQALQGFSILQILTIAVAQDANVSNAAEAAFVELLLGYSRQDEFLADQLGVRYAKLAGYNPKGMIDFLDKLAEINRKKPPQPKSYFKTHPYVPDRIRVIKGELGENMDFEDYINIEDNPHK